MEDFTSKQLSSTYRQILWRAPVFDPSGYANHSRHLLRHISKYWSVRLQPITRASEKFLSQMNSHEREALIQLTNTPLKKPYLQFLHAPAYAFARDPQASYNIGRTLFETDRLPSDWVHRCNMMDEIWVTTHFNLETFRRAGVTSPIYVIPEGVDVTSFRPGLPPFSIPKRRKFAFLSIFEWTYRKGWDILLRAWAEAFKPEEDVCLVLKTYPINTPDNPNNQVEIEARLNKFFAEILGRSRDEVAPIIVLTEQMPDRDIPRLYAAANAYVMPSRGEGWGRPYIEAMAMGLPVIGTRWSGNLEFMNENNSYLIEINGLAEIGEEEEIPFLRGHRWAVPSVEHLIELMRFVYRHPKEAERKAQRALQEVSEKWSWEKAAAKALKRLEEIRGYHFVNKEAEKIADMGLKKEEQEIRENKCEQLERTFYIVRYAGMGDVLMALPVARAFKHYYPKSKIIFLTDKKYKLLVEANPYVDEVKVIDHNAYLELKRKVKSPQEALFDLNPAKFGVGEIHQVEAFLDEVGLPVPNNFKEIVLNVPVLAEAKVNSLLKEKGINADSSSVGGGTKIVIIHAAKNDPNRTWPETHWNRLVGMVIDEGHIVIATGDNKLDPKRGVISIAPKGVINLVDQLNLLEFVTLCRKADLLITTDSGVVQLAAASDIAIAGIYTVIPGRCRLPYRYGKLMWNCVAIEPECAYLGCYRWMKNEKYFACWREKIEKKEITPVDLFAQWCLAEEKYICLQQQITPEAVWQKSKTLLLSQAEHFIEIGESLFSEGKIDEAKNLFQKALAKDSNQACALNNLGVIAFQEGKIDEAVSYFSRSLKIDEDYFEAIDNLGKCMLAKRSYKEAAYWFEKGLNLQPNNVHLLNSLAGCFIQLSDFDKAEKIYRKSLQLNCLQPAVDEIIQEIEKLKASVARGSQT